MSSRIALRLWRFLGRFWSIAGTVRRCVRAKCNASVTTASPKEETLLEGRADFLRERAPQVQYPAQILFRQLRRERSYTG